MRKKKNVRHYSKRIAKETGLPEEVVHKILMHGWKNVLGSIKRKEDVALQGFGRIWTVKKPVRRKEQRLKELPEVEVAPYVWDLL